MILYLFQRFLLKKKKELERICLKMRVDLAISIRGPMGGTCLGRGPLPSEEAGAAVLLGTKTHIFIDSFIETSEPGKFQAPRLSHSLAAPPSLGCGFHGNSLSQLLMLRRVKAPGGGVGCRDGSWHPTGPGRAGGEEALNAANVSPTVPAHPKRVPRWQNVRLVKCTILAMFRHVAPWG